MKRFLFLLMILSSYATAQNLKARIVPNDPAKYKELSAVHAGAGKMGFTQLIGRTDLSTNFLYLHTGLIQPKSGIGHHFHHNIEEMYLILNGEAEFTVNGRTSKIKGPAVVPCRMGDSHAIYNTSPEPLRWMNFAVSRYKGQGDAFDLGDSRAGAKTDPVPVFVSARLERDKLKTAEVAMGGEGVLHRRIFGPAVFETDWTYVDHVIISAGKSSMGRQLQGIEEVYYVIKGSGTVSINEQNETFKTDDAFFGSLGETITVSNEKTDDLELLVIGVAASKQKYLSNLKPLTQAKAMALQMDFVVPKENAEEFEKMYYSIYVPAMTVQQGYLGSKLLRLFSERSVSFS